MFLCSLKIHMSGDKEAPLTFLDLLLFFSERSIETDSDPSFDLDRLKIKRLVVCVIAW